MVAAGALPIPSKRQCNSVQECREAKKCSINIVDEPPVVS